MSVKDTSSVLFSLGDVVSHPPPWIDSLIISLINQVSSTETSSSSKGFMSPCLLRPLPPPVILCGFYYFRGFWPPPPPPSPTSHGPPLCPVLPGLGPLSDYYAIKPLLLWKSARVPLQSKEILGFFLPPFPEITQRATRAWVSNWPCCPWRQPPPFLLMKSLGLNYTFQTLIVIDKTPVARTNDGRLVPLQAVLQEEKERNFKSTM